MIPDILHFIIPLWLMNKSRKENFATRPILKDRKIRRDFCIMLFIVMLLFLLCTFL